MIKDLAVKIKKSTSILKIGLVFFTIASFHAQNRKLDSLKSLLNDPIDSTRAKAHNSLASYYAKRDLLLARQYVNPAIKISSKAKYKRGLGDSYSIICNILMNSGKFDSAIYYNSLAAQTWEELGNRPRVVAMHGFRGDVEEAAGDYHLARKTFSACVQEYAEIGDTINMADAYIHLARMAMDNGKLDQAMEMFLKAKQLFELCRHEWGLVVVMNDMCTLYGERKQFDKKINAQRKVVELCYKVGKSNEAIIGIDNLGTAFLSVNNLDSAEFYFMKAYHLLKDLPEHRGRPLVWSHLAVINHLRNRLPQAEKYYFETKAMYEAVNNMSSLAAVFTNLGELYFDMKKYNLSEEYYLKSKEIHEKLDAKPSLENVYNGLRKLYHALGKHDLSFEYGTKLVALKDTLYLENNQKAVEEMEAKFNSDQKEKELELKDSQLSNQRSEIKSQNLQKMILAIGASTLLVIGILLLVGMNRKRKANLLLESQKEEILSQKHIIEEKNKDITDSIRYAKRIQEAILPADELVDAALPEHFILYEPKDIVSGDFYWVQKHGDLSLFAVADCTGHGVPGALMSVVCSNALSRAVNEKKIFSPALILDEISAMINDTLRQQRQDSTIRDGMDIGLCVLNRRNGKLLYAGANNPVYLVKHGELLSLPANKQPVGSFLEDYVKPFTEQEVQLEKGDLLFVFSDGFADQFGGEKGKKMKYKRLQELIRQSKELPMKEIKNKLLSEFKEWKGSREQVDDVCILGIRMREIANS
ncbi:MAG: SpoIIE family protein phosphatase [Sphingobacteriaceae bacterium]|nr:SpoIIE family protein phosphatase [Sphingobacteriaceae bacterium]